MIQKLQTAIILTRYGKVLYIPSDCYVGKSLDFYAEYSPEEGVLLNNLVRGKNVIEVGANQGALTIAITASAKHVWAYEPQGLLARLVATQPVLNDRNNLTVINKAVGAEPGLLHLPVFNYHVMNNYGGYGKEYWDKLADNETIQTTPVEITTLDNDFLGKDLPFGGKIDFIKADVEGMEAEVLMGAKGLLAQDKPVLYVENDKVPKAQNLITLLDSLGYTCYWHCPTLFSPNNFAEEKRNIYYGVVSFNLLCIPEGGAWFEVHPDGMKCTPAQPGMPALPYPYENTGDNDFMEEIVKHI